jgi:hypothetical protein
MTEEERLTCRDPVEMFSAAEFEGSIRKVGMFSVGCYRLLWHRLEDGLRGRVDQLEQRVDGEVGLIFHDRSGTVVSCDPGSLGCHFVLDSALERTAQTDVLRDIFGNPFRPVKLDPRWLTPDVVELARGIYDSRAFDRLPILADATQDAGCDNADILDHCRSDRPHVRGCWVIDLLLGKE